MPLFEALKAFGRGEGSAGLGLLFTSADTYEAQRDTGTRLEAAVNRQYQAGLLSQEAAARTLQNIEATNNSTGQLFTTPGDSTLDAFKEGWSEGADRMQRTVKETIRAPLSWTLGAIPWQVWAIAAVVVAYQSGILTALLARLNSRIAKA
jgi:hypothetical protein